MSKILARLARELSMRPLPYFLFSAFLFLYLHVFILPSTPVYPLLGDQLFYLTGAVRMLEGQVIYRDFFEFVFPGAPLIYFGLFKLFGPRLWVPNAMLILLGVGLVCLSVVISKKFLQGWLAFLPALIFLTFEFRLLPDATHHWYSALAAMGALALVMEARSRTRLMGAGALCSVAAFFTQSRGLAAVVGLAVFLLWERHRKRLSWRWLVESQVWLFASFLAAMGILLSYFVRKVGVSRFLDCTFTYVLRHYPSESYSSGRVYMAELPPLPPWTSLPVWGAQLFIYALLPLIYILFLVRHWREVRDRPQEPWDQVMLVNIFGVSLFLGIAPSPSWLRMCSVSLPALMLLVWYVSTQRRFSKLILIFLWATALVLAIVTPARRQQRWRAYLDLPAGQTAFLSREQYERVKWLYQRTRPSDYFLDAYGPGPYFPLGLRNPSPVPRLTASDYTLPGQVAEVVAALERHQVRYVLWWVRLDYPDDPTGRGYRLAPLRTYLGKHYHVVKTFGETIQMWERNDARDDPSRDLPNF